MIDIIITLIIIFIFLICTLIINKKYHVEKETHTYIELKKISKILFVITLILFIIEFILLYFKTNSIIKSLYMSICIAILLVPITFVNLYKIIFKDEYKYVHIKQVITNLNVDKKTLNKYRFAGIKLTDKYEKKDLEIVEENEDLDKLYDKIVKSRSVHNNFLKIIKYNIISYIPILISYIFLPIMGFPFDYSLSLSLLIKLYLFLTSILLYKNLPYDKDVERRQPATPDFFIEKQEIFFSIFEGFFISVGINIVYMYLLIMGGDLNQANTILMTMYLLSNIINTLVHYSERPLYKNIFISLKNYYYIIYFIITILFTILINYITIYNTVNIGLRNYFASLSVAFVFSITYEIIKLARYTTVKGDKNNEYKNNKKYKRS